jgi:hypothetical protein
VIIGIVIRRTVKQHPEIKRGNIQRRLTNKRQLEKKRSSLRQKDDRFCKKMQEKYG